MATAVFFSAHPASAQITGTAGPHAASELVTSGSGEATLSPDRAILRVGIETRGSTAAEAASKNARAVKSVIDRLKTLGYRADSLRTVGFGVTPNYNYDGGGRRLIDYQAMTTLKLTVSRLDRLGTTIDAVLAAGATDLSNIQFESDALPAGRASALERALAAARRDAEALARAAGGRVGRLLEATTQPSGPIYPMEAAMRASNTNLPPQDVLVSVMVQTRWEFLGSGR